MTRKSPGNPARTDIASRLTAKGLDKLTIQDVLEALQQDGIRDLEQLVKRELEQATATVEAPLPVSPFSAPTFPTVLESPHIVHRVPAVPLLIDHTLYDPEDIGRFDGKPLHFVAPVPGGDQVLRAFSGEQWQKSLLVYVQVRQMLSLFDVRPLDNGRFWPPITPPSGPYEPQPPGWPPIGYPAPPPYPPDLPFIPFVPPSDKAPPPPPPPSEAQFFSDINFEGDWLWLGASRQWSDLTKVSRGKFLFWSSDWNDVISSVRAWVGLVVLCEHVNLGGSTFGIPPGGWVDNLVPFGWNDRTSSIVNWG